MCVPRSTSSPTLGEHRAKHFNEYEDDAENDGSRDD
jgi:hypothetical protein